MPPIDRKFNVDSENGVTGRKRLRESTDNAFFVRCGISPVYTGLRLLRVNMQNLEFSVSCRSTFLRGNDEINIFWALL